VNVRRFGGAFFCVLTEIARVVVSATVYAYSTCSGDHTSYLFKTLRLAMSWA
jgi:hypothetical protein